MHIHASTAELHFNAFVLDKATGGFVSRCPSLGLVSQGDTVEQAKTAIESAARVYIRHVVARGILTASLSKHRTPQAIFIPVDSWVIRIPMAQS